MEQIFEGIMCKVFLKLETIWQTQEGHNVAPGITESEVKPKHIFVKLLDFKENHLAARQNDQVA